MDIVWTSQVTHTAVKIVGQECRSATYTQNPGSLVYCIGTTFDAPGGSVANPYEPTTRVDIGNFADERVARAACEAFCEGKTLPEISDVVRAKIIALAATAEASKAPS